MIGRETVLVLCVLWQNIKLSRYQTQQSTFTVTCELIHTVIMARYKNSFIQLNVTYADEINSYYKLLL